MCSFFAAIALSISCSNPLVPSQSDQDLEEPEMFLINDTNSQISIKIALNQDTATSLKDVKITISIKNKSTKRMQLLLDHPKFYTGGLWYDYHFDLLDAYDSTVVFCDNNSMLASIAFPTKAEIDNHRVAIAPKKHLMKTFYLKSLISTKPIGKDLSDGYYRLRLRKGTIASNWSKIVIKK